jgi:hypothetical protein
MLARFRSRQPLEQPPQLIVHLPPFDENASHGSILTLN